MRNYQRKRKSRGGYSGILATPLPDYAQFLGGLLEPGTWAERERRARLKQSEDLTKRIVALFAHYGIEPFDDDGCWPKLVFALARQHVFGFQSAGPKTGRQNKWDGDRLLRLYADYQSRRERGDTHEHAVEGLRLLPAYKKYSKETLDRRVKGAFAEHPFLGRLYKAMKAEGRDMDEWRREVLEAYGYGSPNNRSRTQKGGN